MLLREREESNLYKVLRCHLCMRWVFVFLLGVFFISGVYALDCSSEREIVSYWQFESNGNDGIVATGNDLIIGATNIDDIKFRVGSLDPAMTITDTDGNGNPIGISTSLSTGNSGSGSLTVVLKHEPTKPNNGGNKNRNGTINLNVLFLIFLQKKKISVK